MANRNQEISRNLSSAMDAIAARPLYIDIHFSNSEENNDVTYFPEKKSLYVPSSLISEIAAVRGASDFVALKFRHHDEAIHSLLEPKQSLANLIFTLAEDVRLEALGAIDMAGIAHNLRAKLALKWKKENYYNNSPSLPEIISTALRYQICPDLIPENLIERAIIYQKFLIKKSGKSLPEFASLINDQRVYGKAIIELVNTLKLIDFENESASTEELKAIETSKSETEEKAKTTISSEQKLASQEFKPTESSSENQEKTKQQISVEQESKEADQPSSTINYPDYYHIFTAEYDEIIRPEDICKREELTKLRAQIDQKLGKLINITHRLAAKLQRKLMAKQAYAWEINQEEGILNPARLGLLIADPNYPYPYMYEKHHDTKDTVFTLLLDNSGSMRGRPIMVAALCADILASTLEKCGVKVEILGFTTADWKGGRSRKKWAESGNPKFPGRLNDLRHIIYKDADESWRRSRRNLGLMLREGILKENIDGEAISWAYKRLLMRSENRKILMVISDGAPVDDSTLSVNPGHILDVNLKDTIHMIEHQRQIELTAIGIGHDVGNYYSRAITIRDVEQLGSTMINELLKLF